MRLPGLRRHPAAAALLLLLLSSLRCICPRFACSERCSECVPTHSVQPHICLCESVKRRTDAQEQGEQSERRAMQPVTGLEGQAAPQPVLVMM